VSQNFMEEAPVAVTCDRITLRPITSEDEPFLFRVYASTREEELSVVPWSEAQKAAFLQMQFQAQHAFYAENYTRAQFDVILLDDVPAGRLYVDRREHEIRIVDIALLPDYRRQGIGTLLLQEILTEGTSRGVPVTIHVEMNNPALRLYQRLGFRHVADHGLYYLMQWQPLPPEDPRDVTE